MAVFTEVRPDEAAPLMQGLHLGQLLTLRGIPSGIENTNYFVTTTQGEYVLTLFERLTAEQLPFYLQLMKHLAQRGIPVPEPQADSDNNILHFLAGKPAAVVNRLSGQHELSPQPQHCAAVGAMLARMHVAGQDFSLQQPNLRGLSWLTQTIPTVLEHLSADQRALIESELSYQQALAASASYQSLPRGPIHADLFRDNVMFDGDQLSGFFDFYFAGCDTWLFDIAVCLNDWCIDPSTGALDNDRATAFVKAYESVRALTQDELELLPAMLRAGALRFWTSRLWDYYLPRQASMLQPHDPRHFERVLSQRVNHPWHYPTNGTSL